MAYRKLADGRDVNLLVVGDSIAEGCGASAPDGGWADLLAQALREEYGSRVALTNVSMGGNASYAGYARTMALPEGPGYDLAVLCYGQNDSEEDFGLFYESIVRAVKLRYPEAAVICVLESAQREYTPKMRTIRAVAEHYGLPVADTIAPFLDGYDALVRDGVHPNDAGHRVYCGTVMDVIRPLAAARRGGDPENVPPMDPRVTVLDTFRALPAEAFSRSGNAFALNTRAEGPVLGIDYDFTPGENTCRILADGELCAAPEIAFNYTFCQHHILIVNGWPEGAPVSAEREIRVVFPDSEAGKRQADAFRGLFISG